MLQRRKLVEGDCGQGGEILRPLRDAVRGEIGGTAAHHAAHRADPGRDKSAVGERADAQSYVDMIVDEVEIAVGKHQPHVDLGPLLKKLGDDRQNMQPAKDDRRGDDEIAPGRGALPGGRALGLAHLVEDALRRRDIGRALLGQRQLAGRADEEPRIQMRFELGNLAADRRQRHAELAAGGGQGARLGDRDQEGHSFEAVHIP